MLADEILWPEPPPGHAPGRSDIDLWAISLERSDSVLRELAATLSPTELERAARFHFERDRNRFVAGRAILRTTLSRCLETKPQALEFVYGPQGKPSLAGSFASRGLNFNLAHSEDLALLAVTRVGSVGVDIERIRPIPDVEQLVARFFSERESAAFQKLPNDQKPAAFFNLWTRKEAWLKATGEGIGHLLNRVEVSFLPGEPARLLAFPRESDAATPWTLHALAPAAGFAGALAVSTAQARLNCWRWRAE